MPRVDLNPAGSDGWAAIEQALHKEATRSRDIEEVWLGPIGEGPPWSFDVSLTKKQLDVWLNLWTEPATPELELRLLELAWHRDPDYEVPTYRARWAAGKPAWPFHKADFKECCGVLLATAQSAFSVYDPAQLTVRSSTVRRRV